MQVSFNFKNLDPSEHLKSYALTRLTKVGKFLGGDPTATLVVNLGVEKRRQAAEVVLTAENLHLSASEESQDMYAAIDMVLDKLVAQAKKTREKHTDRKRSGTSEGAVRMDILSLGQNESERSIIGTDLYQPKPLMVEEAALQLESFGYEFLVFRNAESQRINVIYQRKDGNFGLIDPGS